MRQNRKTYKKLAYSLEMAKASNALLRSSVDAGLCGKVASYQIYLHHMQIAGRIRRTPAELFGSNMKVNPKRYRRWKRKQPPTIAVARSTDIADNC